MNDIKVKVRNYVLISDLFDSTKGTCLKKQEIPCSLNIVFSENMYIKPLHGFEEKLHSHTEEYLNKQNTQETMMNLEAKLYSLLKDYRDNQLLFLESDLFFFPKEGMIVLEKEPYFDEY